ncbi:MAG: glycosyltransferase family 2 protein [Micromonosporaceae bacterium]
MMPTVSVVIPAHPARLVNGMLQRAVGSVWAQTRPPDAVHIAVDTEGAGAAATRQRALMAADTDFVAFLDSDDLFLPKHLEWLLQHQADTGADFCYAWFKVLQQFANGKTNILEEDPVFPITHYLNDFDPADPIETTITVLVRTELAQQVGFKELDRGEANTGEDRYFTLACLDAGAKITHLRRKSWLWCHHQLPDGTPGNTSGRSTKGDAAA